MERRGTEPQRGGATGPAGRRCGSHGSSWPEQLTTAAVDICARVPWRCPVVVLILDEARGGDKVAVRRALGTIPTLRGRRVGVTPSTLGPSVLSRALAAHDLQLSSETARRTGASPRSGSRRPGMTQPAAAAVQ